MQIRLKVTISNESGEVLQQLWVSPTEFQATTASATSEARFAGHIEEWLSSRYEIEEGAK